MNATQPQWTSHFHVVLLDTAQQRVYLLPGDGGWALPALEEAKQNRWWDVYLAGWMGMESTARLKELWELAKPLAALHQAVSYLHILLGQEEAVHPEMASGLRDFVAHTLKAMGKI
ncbi:MAG: hypothetical protein KJZ86_15225 [Caldilineaceae bacterium]|nr:hypothetical protein [Caldilineaceae bacterium]HRJ42737.1 hypothetical protein [Caldilineaceae bacterium]